MSLCLIIGGVYFKMKNDAREKEKEVYYKEQRERITLYLKYNTKEPNTIKKVDFTNVKVGPMGDVVFEGYINNNKEDMFVAYASPEDNFQFNKSMLTSENVSKLLKAQTKSPDEIKHELSKEK
ncbi:DUF1433 domain-containing protein [Macrococcoides canis]|uniref:DUF1433 domain-containing protein n=1 Tax=Macrococcoides canis TaxID=1855823 RepID=UPI0020B7CE57|nr:DUF1433 domain-containing protein [Macrococcus canis]UTH01202.1 DUF1433 domain-containing protein [Macrococcus canis]UTH03580.1 DUF1433 domain-containing protein [Macrococcus canis]